MSYALQKGQREHHLGELRPHHSHPHRYYSWSLNSAGSSELYRCDHSRQGNAILKAEEAKDQMSKGSDTKRVPTPFELGYVAPQSHTEEECSLADA